jgi:hypothetical protein
MVMRQRYGEAMDGEPGRVVALELELLRPEARSSAERLAELLHPEFTEFGASGRRWQLEDIIGSSIWRRDEGHWRVLFHQGTVI